MNVTELRCSIPLPDKVSGPTFTFNASQQAMTV
jgi:hypothetical protein